VGEVNDDNLANTTDKMLHFTLVQTMCIVSIITHCMKAY